ncbi:class I SAM-dependent methyltransferase [Paenibacillus sp. sgz500992]|uniref:class I SAM-dependent methyltransferase n=1 Tax=Paenibacillus sp. sgz500992 TaxID=3242476 RepID=UPI0036D36147
MNTHEKVKQWENGEGVALFQGLGLAEDAEILDYGCGFGHYTFAASRALNGRGTVYAVDINKECMKAVGKVSSEEHLNNIQVLTGNKDHTLNFEDRSLDMIMYYDILHGNGTHRFTLYEEAKRTLKPDGILSILPFHLSNFRDQEGKKKTYNYKKIIDEVLEFGFSVQQDQTKMGIHFEKYHSSYYIDKGCVEFEALERAEILNFRKNS